MFENINIARLGYQLDIYVHNVWLYDRFPQWLIKKTKEDKRKWCLLLYVLLLKLALLLLMTMATVEWTFSTMMW
jgi:hypothetical protein